MTEFFESHQESGYRSTQEDTYSHLFLPEEKIYIWGLFDGHSGKEISLALACPTNGLVRRIANRLITEGAGTGTGAGVDIEKIMSEEFVKMDVELFNAWKKSHHLAGSTSTVVVLNAGTKQLHSANLGDSSAFLIVNNKPEISFIELTNSHSLEDPVEVKRITDAGGKVEIGYQGVKRLYGSVNMGRTHGNFGKKYGEWMFEDATAPTPTIDDVVLYSRITCFLDKFKPDKKERLPVSGVKWTSLKLILSMHQ
jgi:serine/threonine protein phosphatase PrpC